MQILTTVWGKKHIDMFKNTLLRSMAFTENKKSLEEYMTTWNIFTDDVPLVNDICKTFEADVLFNINGTELLRDYIDPSHSAFIWQMKRCLEFGEKLIVAPPDLLFGNGTIPNMIKIGDDYGSVVVIPHMRTNPSVFSDITSDISNPKLVTLAFKHIHRSWIDAEKCHPHNTSYHGGVEWEKLGPNLYSVNHRLPAPYLINFTKEDLDYFESAQTFNSLDHFWPGDILVPRGRQRYVGSSDACFLIEPTEEENNIPNLLDYAVPGGFCRNLEHNKMNAQIRAIFRGE